MDTHPPPFGKPENAPAARPRPAGRLGNGRFLVLCSAVLDLLRQAGESLAGRTAHIELGGLD